MQPSIKKFSLTGEYYFHEGCYITEISNSQDDPNLSIARARVEPGVHTELHYLKDTVERYVILQGEGLVEVGSLLRKSVSIYDVIIIPPNCSQRITNTGSEDLLFLAICSPKFKNDAYKQLND